MKQQPSTVPLEQPITDHVGDVVLSGFRKGRGTVDAAAGPDPALASENLTTNLATSEAVHAMVRSLADWAEECVVDGDHAELMVAAREAVHLGNWLGHTWCRLDDPAEADGQLVDDGPTAAGDMLASRLDDIDSFDLYNRAPDKLRQLAEVLHTELCERHDLDPGNENAAVLHTFIADGVTASAIGLAYDHSVLRN